LFKNAKKAVGWDQIQQDVGLTKFLAEALRGGPHLRLVSASGRRIDSEEIAFALGVSITEIERRLANKRIKTRRAALSYLSAAIVMLAFWAYAEILYTYVSWSYVASLLSICVAFFLASFYNALINWQIRTRRLGTWLEFLYTNDSWWPS